LSHLAEPRCIRLTLDELEAIARLFPAARPMDPASAKSAALRKEIDSRNADLAVLAAEKTLLQEQVKKLTEELEKLKRK